MRTFLCLSTLWLGALLCVPAFGQRPPLMSPAPQRPARPNSSYDFGLDSLATALKKDSLFIGKSFRGKVDEAALRKLIAQQPADQPLKIVIASGFPKNAQFVGGGPRGYVRALHKYLGLNDGILLKVSGRGTIGVTDRLTPGLTAFALGPVQTLLNTDPTNGIIKAVSAMDAKAEQWKGHLPIVENLNGPTPHPPPTRVIRPPIYLIVLPFCTSVGSFVILVILLGRSRWQRQVLSSARLPFIQMQTDIRTVLANADTRLAELGESPDAAEARKMRRIAGTLLDQANLVAGNVKTRNDLERAKAVLELAKEKSDICRQQIDAAKDARS